MQAYKTPKNQLMPWLQALETDTPNCSKPKQLSPDKSGLKARTCYVKSKPHQAGVMLTMCLFNAPLVEKET